MVIKNIFKKDINRNIETVIKADDRDHISDEVAEYVITNEIAKKIRDLFSEYNLALHFHILRMLSLLWGRTSNLAHCTSHHSLCAF